MPKPTASDFNKIIIKSLDTNKVTGPDSMPAKFFQISANVTDCHLFNIIACDISKNRYSKQDQVRPVFKKDDRTKIKKYWPVSHLNMFSEIYKRFLHENLMNFVNTFLSNSFLLTANVITTIIF